MLTIRRAVVDDADDMAKREEECFTKEGWSQSSIIEGMNYPDRVFLLAILDGVIVGHGCITSVCGQGEISNIAVTTDARRRGIAKRILEELISTGTEMGDEAFTLEVRENNTAAIALYEKMGFVSAGIRPHFYQAPDEGAMIMWKK